MQISAPKSDSEMVTYIRASISVDSFNSYSNNELSAKHSVDVSEKIAQKYNVTYVAMQYNLEKGKVSNPIYLK